MKAPRNIGWGATSLPVVPNVEAVELGKLPCVIKEPVHAMQGSMLNENVEEIVASWPFGATGRRFVDRSFQSAAVVECVTPFPPGLSLIKVEWKLQTLGNELIHLLTGNGYRPFHQDIQPPLDSVSTLHSGEKLWTFRAPGSRDCETLVKLGHTNRLQQIRDKMHAKNSKKFIAGIQKREGKRLPAIWMGTLCHD